MVRISRAGVVWLIGGVVTTASPAAFVAAAEPAPAASSASQDTARVSAASVQQLVAHRRRGFDLTYVARTTLARDLPVWRADAGKNRPDGQLMLGLCNYYGLGGPANAARGLALVEAAAKSGHAEAMAVYSILLRNGTTETRPDTDLANEWLGKAFGKQSAIARDEVALAAAKDLLIEGKTDEAFEAYATGDKAGNLTARVALAGMIRREWLVHDSIPTSMKLLEDAANEGHVGAMVELGQIYAFGRYVPCDLAKAKRWLDAAAATGDPRGLFTAARAYETGTLDAAGKPDPASASKLWAKLEANGDPYSIFHLYLAAREPGSLRKGDDAAKCKYLLDAGARGVPEAYAFIGQCYYDGELSTPKDVEKCLRYFEDGIAANDPAAVYQRGCAYRFGYSGKPDEDKARADYFAAARLGVPRAMTSVARRYMEGRGVKLDVKAGHLFYLAAACEGDPDAMAQVADDLEQGLGVEADLAEAKRWALAAINAGSNGGYQILSMIYGERDAVARRKPLPRDSVELLEKGAKAGSIECARRLGNYLIGGTFVPKDEKRGLAMLEEAAKRDQHGEVLLVLGDHYAYGTNIPKDPSAALLYYRKSADLGNAAAWYRLGNLYGYGIGVAKSGEETVRCLEKGVDLGSSDCAWRLGELYLNGEFVTKDIDRGLALVKRAADANYAQAFGVLAEYAFGEGGKPVDEVLGISLATRGVSLGDGRAAWVAGHYFEGRKDDAKAFEWYRRGAELENAACQNNLGVCYRFGRGTMQDFTQAAKYYKLAADAGNEDATSNYAWCLETGNGVAMDKGEAFRMQLKLALAGSAIGMYHTGRMYFDGIGVTKDRQAASDWLQKAAAAGEPHAIKIVEAMRMKGLIK